jgi:5-methylcytosine-specific restriction endonuclease McrA
MSDAEKAADRDRKREKSTANYRRRWEQEHPGVTWEQHCAERAAWKAGEAAREREKTKAYNIAHRAEIAEARRRFRAEYPDKYKEQAAKWREANAEAAREYDKARQRDPKRKAYLAEKRREYASEAKAREQQAREEARKARPLALLVKAEERVARQAQQAERQAEEKRIAHVLAIEALRARRKAWDESHPEDVAQREERRRATRTMERSAYKRRRRARIRNAEGRHGVKDVRLQIAAQTPKGGQHVICWWCDREIKGQYHVDHRVPLARGGGDGPGNIVIACPRCNTAKRDRLPEEFAGRLL